ncbi:MAG: hypothetical protein JNM94_06630 [Phycisphaerae bacterium]|nr:hypothetical protein [Phycisphaerae bacterium]
MNAYRNTFLVAAAIVAAAELAPVAMGAAPVAASKAELASLIATERASIGAFTARYITSEVVPGDSEPQRTWSDLIVVDPNVGFRHEHAWTDEITRPGAKLGGESIVAFDGAQIFTVSPADGSGIVSANCEAMQLRDRAPLLFHLMRWYPGLEKAGCDAPADLLSYLGDPTVELMPGIEEIDGAPCVCLERRSLRPDGPPIVHARLWLDIEHGYLPRLQQRYRIKNGELVVGTEYRVLSYAKVAEDGWVVASAERVIPAASAEERNGWGGRVKGVVQTMTFDPDFADGGVLPYVAVALGAVPDGTTIVDLETGELHVLAPPPSATDDAMAALPASLERTTTHASMIATASTVFIAALGASLIGRRRSLQETELLSLRRESKALVGGSEENSAPHSPLPHADALTLADFVHSATRFKHVVGTVGRTGRRARRRR